MCPQCECAGGDQHTHCVPPSQRPPHLHVWAGPLSGIYPTVTPHPSGPVCCTAWDRTSHTATHNQFGFNGWVCATTITEASSGSQPRKPPHNDTIFPNITLNRLVHALSLLPLYFADIELFTNAMLVNTAPFPHCANADITVANVVIRLTCHAFPPDSLHPPNGPNNQV